MAGGGGDTDTLIETCSIRASSFDALALAKLKQNLKFLRWLQKCCVEGATVVGTIGLEMCLHSMSILRASTREYRRGWR